ncbi:MAG: methionyl-tRNA formyltransferase [Clostridia bacterium]|nr:methionyl-tRNA formyltransferase [Clostridia bacterium]
MRILFMGTPDFALFSLRALVESGEEIVGVVTQPDKPRGRGKSMSAPPVKAYAESIGLSVYQPQTMKDGAFLDTLRSLDPELIVVTAYGKILPSYILDYPKYGCLNVHGSLLPRYRGAAPMQRVLMNGERKTGVTIMYMDVGLDTGDMMLKRVLPIGENDNFETVHDGLGVLGAEAILEAVALLKSGNAPREKQDDALSTYAEKITKEDCLLDVTRTSSELHNTVRGLSPIPVSFFLLPDGKMLKVLEARKGSVNSDKTPGTVLALSDSGSAGILIACGEGSLLLTRVVPEGKKPMDAIAFANGKGLKVGDRLL